jgi:hypothetical protein
MCDDRQLRQVGDIHRDPSRLIARQNEAFYLVIARWDNSVGRYSQTLTEG